MVRVPERQQPKAQAHSEGFPTKDITRKLAESGKFWVIPRVQKSWKSSLP
jgi:hypothetical protein